jgi:hypothetical protein
MQNTVDIGDPEKEERKSIVKSVADSFTIH